MKHRIVWHGRELKYDLVITHCQGHLPLDQPARNPIQSPVNTPGDEASTTSLDNLFQCLTTFIFEEVTPIFEGVIGNQSLGTPPNCRDFSNVDSSLATSSTRSPGYSDFCQIPWVSALSCFLNGLRADLLLQQVVLHSLSPCLCLLCVWLEHLPVKTETKSVAEHFYLLQISENQVSLFLVTWSHIFPILHFITDITHRSFTSCHWHMWQGLILSGALAFLTCSLAVQTISLYSSQTTCLCFHALQACFLCLCLSERSLSPPLTSWSFYLSSSLLGCITPELGGGYP